MQQAGYQVRFGFGLEGLRACASDADVIVWVDALTTEPSDTATVSDLLDTAPETATLVSTNISTSRAVAQWVLDYQTSLNRRLAIAVIASSPSYAVSDFLAAGSVIDALSELGLDATSPEAATAEAAYRSLAGAIGHLVTASVEGRQMSATVNRARVDPTATVVDVRVLRDVCDMHG
jgi:hypothetical protein